MESDKENDLIELKTELGTVVEALSVLNEFIENIFGAKYHNFLSNGAGAEDGNGGVGGIGAAKNIQSALKRLRWKHSSGKCEDDAVVLSTPSSVGAASRESKGDNGYSSAGGTPTTTAVGDDMRRRDSQSSLTNQIFSPTGGGRGQMNEDRGEKEGSCRLSLSVGRPEIVAVKCEVNDADFFDDVDPFGSEPGDYHYEGEESELKIEDCYPLQQSAHLPSEDNCRQTVNIKSPPGATDLPNIHSNSSPRFIPELIPIQPDPLHHNATSVMPVSTVKEEAESGSSSSDNSDTEWHPSSAFTSAPSSKRKPLTKTKRPIQIQPDRISINNFTPNNLSGNFTLSRQQPTSILVAGLGDTGGTGGPFKCDMCPASYKQEESLRSHQKYKHNPSRVTQKCTICNKTMVDKYRLQRHLRLHTGEKPFECEYCGQSFYRKDYHTKHLQRKHGISYNAAAPSKIIRKPAMGKPKPAVSSSSSPYSISSNSSVSSSSFQNFSRSGVFETPSPPPLGRNLAGREIAHRLSLTSTTTSPSSSSTSPATTSSPITTTREIIVKEQSNFVDIFPSHGSGQGVGISDGIEFSSGVGGIGNLMTMTSLTFDDLISADL